MKHGSIQIGGRVLLLAAVLAVALGAGVQPAPPTAALWAPSRPAAQQVEERRTLSRCMTNLAELTGFSGEARDAKWVQPGMWGSNHRQAETLVLILTFDPVESVALPRAMAQLSRHVLNLPPPV